jgi:peptidylprolyl isomerase
MFTPAKAVRRALLCGSIGLLGASACASSAPPAPRAPSPDDDRKAVLAQELGEVPAPEGPCPERSEPNVLENPRAHVHRTALGLAYCILQEGPAGTVPGANDSVRVHYTGWTVEGQMFDSSVERGEPLELPLNGVIRGWTEGLRLMTPGDKARLWIPGNLGYGRRDPGEAAGTPPKGTLVFDIELLSVTRETPVEEAPKEEAKADDDSRPRLNPRLPRVEEKKKRQGRRQDGPQTRTNPMSPM